MSEEINWKELKDKYSPDIYADLKLKERIAVALEKLASTPVQKIIDRRENKLRVEEEVVQDVNKVYNFKYKDGKNKICQKCNSLISFDDYNKETHPWPTHVNEQGHMIGDGSCPAFKGG
jgi:hypothetical protein